MTSTYQVLIETVSEVHTLPGMWTHEKLSKVLELAEFDDTEQMSEAELFDMCVMALQELDHQRAGELVLEAVFGDGMRPGVRQNLVDDLEEDQPWDDVADLAQQKGVFEALVLLQQAFPNRYGTPDAQKLRLIISEGHSASLPSEITPMWLLEILAGCLTDRDILIRLYGDDIRTGSFSNAEHIIWWYADSTPGPDSRICELISSRQWFASLHRGDKYEVKGIR